MKQRVNMIVMELSFFFVMRFLFSTTVRLLRDTFSDGSRFLNIFRSAGEYTALKN